MHEDWNTEKYVYSRMWWKFDEDFLKAIEMVNTYT